MPQTPNVVLRERLIAAVDARWEGGFGLVLGGAGLGKSTLIRQAMLESATLGRGRELLIRCRPDWTATSVHSAVWQQLATGDETPVSDPRPEAVAEYLWSTAPARSGLVFDDLHLLDESGIAYLLELREVLPTNAHLLVASRETALLTALLMTANPSLVVDDEALLFTDGEVDTFAAETGAHRPALERAGGWPAVLALTASAGTDVAGAYLYQKVLAGLSRRQQGDLAIAAALGDLDEELARSVLDASTADLAAIPLVETPATGGIIVHDLWREPLAGLVDPERLNTARKTVAVRAESTGDVDRAVSVLTEGALTLEARKVILRHIATGADRVPVDRIDRWLRVVNSPEHALLRSMLQLLRRGLVAGSLSDLELDDFTGRCQDAGEPDLEAVVCEIQFAVSWSADDADACVAIAERLAELHLAGVEEAAHGRFMRDVTTARSEGNNLRVLEVIRQARHEVGTFVGPDWNTALELETLVSLGRPFEALALLKETEERLAERKVRSVTYGLTYWFSGRADEALRSLASILAEPGRFDGLERSWRATLNLFEVYRGIPATAGLAQFGDEDERFSTYSRVCEGLAEIAEAIHEGDETLAAERLGSLARRLPPEGGFTLQAWFMGAAMWYVLRPDDRPLLDAFMVDNFYGEAAALFRSVVEGRERGEISADLIAAWPTPAQVGTVLPTRWAAEVALRLPASHRDLRDGILDGLEGRGRPALDLLSMGERALADLATAAMSDRPHAPGDAVVVRLFGAPQLLVPDHDGPQDWRRGRVRALMGFLATRRRVTREATVQALWPELDAQAGRRNLRVTLSYLTKALEPGRTKTSSPWFVRTDGEMLELRTDGLTLDVITMQNNLRDADVHRSSGIASKAIESLRVGLELYAGPFLQGLDDEWILEQRSYFERQAVNGCLRLSALLQAGRSTDAVSWARRAIEIDPLSIDAREVLIDALRGGLPHEIDAARQGLTDLLNDIG